MVLTSQINPSYDHRSNARIAIGRDGTIRDAADRPVEVVVQDVSASGCLLHSPLALPENQVLNIGLPGLGRREGRIAWRQEERHGIEFLWPLSAAELDDVQTAETLVVGTFPQRLDALLIPDVAADPASRLSAAAIVFMVAASAAIWACLGYGSSALIG